MRSRSAPPQPPLTHAFARRYGEEVENYLEVYLRTPGLDKKDVARALLARGNARKTAGDRLLARAQQDFQAVAKLDPSNRELQGYLRRSDMVRRSLGGVDRKWGCCGACLEEEDWIFVLVGQRDKDAAGGTPGRVVGDCTSRI